MRIEKYQRIEIPANTSCPVIAKLLRSAVPVFNLSEREEREGALALFKNAIINYDAITSNQLVDSYSFTRQEIANVLQSVRYSVVKTEECLKVARAAKKLEKGNGSFAKELALIPYSEAIRNNSAMQESLKKEFEFTKEETIDAAMSAVLYIITTENSKKVFNKVASIADKFGLTAENMKDTVVIALGNLIINDKFDCILPMANKFKISSGKLYESVEFVYQTLSDTQKEKALELVMQLNYYEENKKKKGKA